MIQAESNIAFYSFECEDYPASVSISRFQGESGVEEYNLIIHPTRYDSVEAQLEWVHQAYQLALRHMELDPNTSVLRRFFCSDLANQAAVLQGYRFSDPRNADNLCATSLIGQPPAPPAKLALWAYHVYDAHSALQKTIEGSSLSLTRGDLTHIWTTGITCTYKDTSYGQTEGILAQYLTALQAKDLSLKDNVIRTWFFVRDVDANYQGLVDSRREFFAQQGLTADTHYIASTGIEGTSANIAATVTMDAYAISGVRNDQIEYLSAPYHLSPTNIYGVTFERGVSVTYRDRKHIIISGTASIDSAGQIVHPGNMILQFDRTLENIEALLRESEATLRDVSMFIVYVRDPSDLQAAGKIVSERFGETPYQIVIAPVCRPGWLIEIECLAIVPTSIPACPAF